MSGKLRHCGNEHSPDEEGITTGVCARGSCAMMDEALQVQAMGPLPQAVLAKLDALYASDFGRVK